MDTETIKERLNLHVKRRLQSSETASSGGCDADRPITLTATSATVPAKNNGAPQTNTTKTTAKSPKKGRMSRKQMNSSSESINSTVSSTSASATPSRHSISGTPKTPASRKTPTTSIAIVPPISCRTPTTPISTNNNNEGEHDLTTLTGDRVVEKHPDILTMVLNEKKLQLMQDPAVLDFLNNIISLYTTAKMSNK